MSDDFDEPPPEDFGTVPEHTLPSRFKTGFESWHHPRKQYVRVQQWCAAIRALVKELKLTDGEPFRYLTLPGDELLDVRAVRDVCEGQGVTMKFLGFNHVTKPANRNELNLSQNEVLSLGRIDAFSKVIEGKLEFVADDSHPSYRITRNFGPFHAINIDLCNSITLRDLDDNKGSTLGALAKLLELQLQKTTPWLLFITTLAQPELVTEKNRNGFMDAISANTAESPEFKAELAKLISSSADKLDARLGDAWKGNDPDFLRLFCTGLGKWLLSLLSISKPARSLTLLDCCYYRVGEKQPNMLSLVFRCDTQPQALNDRFGILGAAEEGVGAEAFSEVQLAIAMAKTLAKTSDLDALLAGDPAYAERIVGQASRLMATARFDAAAYETWAKAELAKFPPVEPAAA